MMEIRNPQYNALGTIDCEVNFHGIDWLPFTASPDDAEPHGRAIHALAEAMGPSAYVPPEPEPPTVEDYKAAVQAHVDSVAVARLYDSGVSLASYTASTNPQWAAEASAFVAWRDAVWAQVYGMWASPPDPVPTPADVVSGLPVIEWPEA